MCAKKRSRNSSWAVAVRRVMAVAAVMLALSSATAKAGFITIDQAGMSAIFSQPSFDGTPIDIRFNPPRLIVDPELLVINTQTQLTALIDLAPDPAPTVMRSSWINSMPAASSRSRRSMDRSPAARSCRAMSLSRPQILPNKHPPR